VSELTLSVVLQAVDRLTKPYSKAMQSVAKNSRALDAAKRGVERLGRTDTFGRMEKSIKRANRALKDQEYRLRVIDRMEKKLDANERQRSKLKGKLLGTAAMAVGAAAPIATAANVEDAEIRLRTVINASDVDAGMAKARAAARDLAQEGFVGLTQAFDIQYALNSAGLQADVSTAAADIIAKVAKVTAGVPGEVGSVIAGTYNNMAAEMEGTTNEKLGRIGDLLTKTQFKFQLDNFGQLGEGMSYAAASAASARIPLEQMVTTLGLLNSSTVTGSRAGTAFAAVERNLGKAADEFGFQIVRGADGQMDFIATLEDLDRALSVYDNLDERNQAIQKVFGEEGRAGIAPLLQKLPELRAAYDDVVKGSRGIVDANVKLFKDGGTGPWNQVKGAVITLADSVGKSLLPAINAILVPTAAVISAMADFAEANPTVTAAVFGTVTALVAIRTALIAGKLASLAFSSGLIGSQIGLLKYGSGLIGFATRAVPVVIGAVRAMSVALMTTPIGWIVGGLAIAAGLIIANWDTVKEYMLKIWEPIKPYWEKFAGWVGRLWDTISAPFEAIGKFFSGDDDQPSAVQRAASVARPVTAAAAGVVTAGAIATAPVAAQSADASGQGGAPVSISITVNPAAGQDPEDIAREVVKIIQQRTGAVHD
tara:strand:- start:40841 stop:42799 length:1959 start_codon:yes stop_codon:yes gene_type:complete